MWAAAIPPAAAKMRSGVKSKGWDAQDHQGDVVVRRAVHRRHQGVIQRLRLRRPVPLQGLRQTCDADVDPLGTALHQPVGVEHQGRTGEHHVAVPGPGPRAVHADHEIGLGVERGHCAGEQAALQGLAVVPLDLEQPCPVERLRGLGGKGLHQLTGRRGEDHRPVPHERHGADRPSVDQERVRGVGVRADVDRPAPSTPG